MKRLIVLGGSGFFGRLIVEKLAADGLQPIAASRSSGEIRIDANNPEDIRANLKQRDLVIDAAGPFQRRTPALIDAARTIGFDVIDLSDSPEYTAMVYERETPISAAGIRVLTACSSLSTVSAMIVKTSGIEQPRRLSVYLVPASRHTANPGSIKSFLSAVEGRSRSIRFAVPLGMRSGVTVKSVDSVTLPRLFSSLQTTELIVDSGNMIGNFLLPYPGFRRLIERHLKAARAIAHLVGEKAGVLAFEVAATAKSKQVIFMGERTHMLAVIPAIEAARAIADGRLAARGLIPPTEHVDPFTFWDAVRREGISVRQ
jgi:NAD(P)-dependent dehydrogenase (short-subunit alcohol dehydrogenase family)